MDISRTRRYAPLAGVVFVGCTVAAFATPESPDSKASGAKVIAYYRDHRGSARAAEVLVTIAAVAAVVYFSSLASYLRRRGADVLATTTVAGAILLASGMCIAAGLSEAGADQYQRMTPSTAQTLNLLSNDAFVFVFLGGLTLATLSAGISMLLTKALPKALGIITVVVGVVAASVVVSWFAFLASGPLTLVIAGYLYKRLDAPSEIAIPEIPSARVSEEATTTTGHQTSV